ncbi:HNH endonuclease [Leptolyngbyaceae cyanobacterium CCMR0082]|uniref:HNH endonuclease n=1 Tax=Adonisia turfae CCMR0082 TaxID=2304604 RepID=A0A6M0SCN9_9CYAN|nr:HNH endonuclease [Adonisia turfae]NEZ66255.1 HNH endonuclease [Adonisia turfae CCMR0082]
MPMDRSLYPDDWDEIALNIKNEAKWVCDDCGKICRKSGESVDEFVVRINAINQLFSGWPEDISVSESEVRAHPQRWTLTVAHLDHQPQNCDRTNLKALCAPCHCRYDLQPSSMFVKKQLKLERCGQLSLEVG